MLDRGYEAVRGMRTKSLSSLLEEGSQDEAYLSLLLAKKLKAEREKYPTYGEMFDYPAFAQEILAFAKECVLYDIQAENLPCGNASENELKNIVKAAMALPLTQIDARRIRDTKIASVKELKEAEIVLPFLKDTYHAEIVKELCKSIPAEENKSAAPQKHLMYALTPRQEAEAIIQQVIREEKTCNIILCSPSDEMPIFEEVLCRYDVPYSAVSVSADYGVYRKYAALLKIAVRKDSDSLFDAIADNAFATKLPDDLLPFLKDAMTGLEAPCGIADIFQKSTLFQSYAIDFDIKEKRTARWFENNRKDILSLVNCTDGKQMMNAAFEIMRRNPILQDAEALKHAVRLRKTIETCMDEIETAEDAAYIAEILRSTSFTARRLMSDFCIVTDLTHPVDMAEVSYVVGVNGTSYPGFTPLSGLFDESYVKKVSEYPTLEERHDLYISQLSWIENSASQDLYYSYASNDYEGREIQLAYEIDMMFSKKEKWNLERKKPYVKPDASIDRVTAENLYLDKSKKITGSISTIERWFACPYSWFIQSGLKVREKQQIGLDNASIGTIQHGLMEYAFHQLKKDYGEISADVVQTFLKECFDTLRAAHPKDAVFYDLTEKRMTETMIKELRFLADYEKHTSFIPENAEYKFLEPLTTNVILRGTIDRYDTYGNELVRVMDYKSSVHELKKSEIEAGRQLQLLSYLMIAEKLTQLKPSAAVYISMKEEDVTIPASKTEGRGKKRQVAEQDLGSAAVQKEKQKAQQLNGKVFVERKTEMDDSGAFLKTGRSVWDYEAYRDGILKLYEYFYENIANGNIALKPKENACGFCKYKPVCKFRGLELKTKSIVDING